MIDYKANQPNIIYIDEYIVVCNKLTNMLSVPGKGEGATNNLYSILLQDIPSLRIVHRLDMATSGLIVFARDKESEKNLHEQFRNRLVAKRYTAITEGTINENSGSICLPIARDWDNRPRQKICKESGKSSLTNWKKISQINYKNNPLTLLALWPLTGRSHQIRIHLANINLPIVGDELYNLNTKLNTSRTMLHASMIKFNHPVTNKCLKFRASLPLYFKILWQEK